MNHAADKINKLEAKCVEIKMTINRTVISRDTAVAAIRKPFDDEVERLDAQLQNIQDKIVSLSNADGNDELEVPRTSSNAPKNSVMEIENALQQDKLEVGVPINVKDIVAGTPNNPQGTTTPTTITNKSHITFTITNSDHVNIRL